MLGQRWVALAGVGALALGVAASGVSAAEAAPLGHRRGSTTGQGQVAVMPLDHKPTAAEQRRLAASPRASTVPTPGRPGQGGRAGQPPAARPAAQPPAARPLPATCDPTAAEALLRSGVTLIDVRSAEEFAEGHVAGARLLPLPELDTWAAGLDPKKPYLVVCRSGARSARAIAALKAKGFTQLINLDGGMLRWQSEAKPVARP